MTDTNFVLCLLLDRPLLDSVGCDFNLDCPDSSSPCVSRPRMLEPPHKPPSRSQATKAKQKKKQKEKCVVDD
jgi:hypothetical protein